MRDAQGENHGPGERHESAGGRWMVSAVGLTLLFTFAMAPARVDAMGELLTINSDNSEVPLKCSNAVMTTAPTFLSAPKGSAKYPFSMKCISPNIPGIMKFSWEGSWTPSETRRDRPNASESLTITGYEPFLPGRAPGGKIFMYWTGSCTADPWLQGGSCSRFGEYMPDDLRAAFPNVGRRPFPITGNSISPALKQQLVKQYQEFNQQLAGRQNQQQLQSSMLQLPSQGLTPSQRAQALTVQPQAAIPKPSSAVSALSRSGILARGVEGQEGPPADQPESGQSEAVESPAMALLEQGPPEINEAASLRLDRPLHVVTANGEAIVLTPGTYEVGSVLDVQLGLAREGQPTVLLHAHQGTHNESLQRSIALAIPGESDQVHLILMTSDGRRFEAQGSTSGVKSRGTEAVTSLPDKKLQDAIQTATATPRSVSPACQPNPADIGPRWVPVPCTMPATPSTP